MARLALAATVGATATIAAAARLVVAALSDIGPTVAHIASSMVAVETAPYHSVGVVPPLVHTDWLWRMEFPSMVGLFQLKTGSALAAIIWAAGTVARALPSSRSMRHTRATAVELVPCGVVAIMCGRIVANVAFSVVAVAEDIQAHDFAAPCDLLVQFMTRMALTAAVRAASPIACPTCCVIADLSDSGSTKKAGFSRVVGVKTLPCRTVGDILDNDSAH